MYTHTHTFILGSTHSLVILHSLHVRFNSTNSRALDRKNKHTRTRLHKLRNSAHDNTHTEKLKVQVCYTTSNSWHRQKLPEIPREIVTSSYTRGLLGPSNNENNAKLQEWAIVSSHTLGLKRFSRFYLSIYYYFCNAFVFL